ncbi:MAG: hypothetical protein CMP39_07320 [Rickettsiales bacterium]|nr:hypothetical protein [Rickettsiales bacterium]
MLGSNSNEYGHHKKESYLIVVNVCIYECSYVKRILQKNMNDVNSFITKSKFIKVEQVNL